MKDGETISDIVAEMREPRTTGITEHNDWLMANLRHFADRIEAAAKRDTQNAMKTAFMAKCEVCEKLGPARPGNAAKMREALEMFVSHASCLYHCDIHRFYPNTTECDGVLADKSVCSMKPECDAVFAGRAALAAPARNCDRFKTEEEAYAAFMSRFDHFGGERHYQYCAWLFAPAKEGGAE